MQYILYMSTYHMSHLVLSRSAQGFYCDINVEISIAAIVYNVGECVDYVFVVRLPRPTEGKGVTPIFSSLQNFSSTTCGWSHWNTLLCFFKIC